MVDLGFMKLPCAGDFSVFKLLFGMACACLSIASVFASTELVGPALATSLEASRGGVDLEPLIAALRPAALVTSVGAVPAALTGFAVGSLALFPGLPAAPFYTYAHFKCHTRKHKRA